MMTKSLDQIADKAARQIISAYWAAIDPETLTAQRWVIDLLGEAYESALDAEEHPSGWESGRDI